MRVSRLHGSTLTLPILLCVNLSHLYRIWVGLCWPNVDRAGVKFDFATSSDKLSHNVNNMRNVMMSYLSQVEKAVDKLMTYCGIRKKFPIILLILDIEL